jgi:hypothetical protein
MTALKLDKYNKARIRQEARRRADAERQTLFDGARATLNEIAERLARAKWDTPEKQADMLVLEKYGLANIITGVNIRVQDPETKRYEHSFGALFVLDIMCPGGSKSQGEVYNYMSADGISIGDPDHAALWQIVEWRRNQERIGYEERDALDAYMRTTTSVAKVIEAYPWVGDLFAYAREAA